MKRVFNFSAGPAILPEDVLREAQEEMFNYGNTGMSVMEMSHRSKPFEKILNDAINDLNNQMDMLRAKRESITTKKDYFIQKRF